MILVKCKKEADFYWGDSLGIVVARIKNDKESYVVYSDKSSLSMPYPYEQQELIFIENTVPDDWVSIVNTSQITIQSFKEWAEDEYFYSYISGSGDNNDIETAKLVLKSKVEKYVNDYAINSAGSIELARKEISENKYKSELKLYEDRGYEIIDLLKPEDKKINDNPIQISDLQYLNS